MDNHGFEYENADVQAKKGLVSSVLLKYLIRPGDVLVNLRGAVLKACVSLGWAQEGVADEDCPECYHEGSKIILSKKQVSNTLKGNSSKSEKPHWWKVPVWYWKFNGIFEMSHEKLTIKMDVGSQEELVRIDEMRFFPLHFAAPTLGITLEKRGRTFWKIHSKVHSRCMIDMQTYKEIHPYSQVAGSRLRSDIETKDMTSNVPPSGTSLLVFPSKIIGYHLMRKTWIDLFVDRIEDIEWNKQAFRDLVVGEETKMLVQALVMKQLVAKKATDTIISKGNGLVILLHGGPGTGKTFTVEGVAEFAEKPLLRVTCGDIGVHAEVVEKRLQSTFHLGKLWDCVVLLDEADVFLEERDMKDLNRNASVSVFLRELEYYNGILKLTSNRVGAFD